MTNVVLAPARFPPHIQMRNGPVTSSRVFGLVFGLVCLSSLLSRLCLSSVLWCGLWSGLWSGAALSSPVSAAASHLITHMKNNHMKNNMHAYSILARIICLPPRIRFAYMRLHVYSVYIRHGRGRRRQQPHLPTPHSRSAQRFHSQNDPR